jgi:hypothetical protein
MVTRLEFILTYSIFLFFLMQISGMLGQSIISGVDPPSVPSAPVAPEKTGFWGFWDGITGIFGYLFTNIAYFFKMMGASSGFALFGAVILAPFLIGLIWIIIEMIRGAG